MPTNLGEPMTEQPPKAAVANGHILEWDPSFVSSTLRWTCRGCAASALRYGRNEYGSATEKSCPGAGDRDDD
jgi:hypothetical protein